MQLPFGITVSGDAFQWKLDNIYNPLPNMIGIADDIDIIIWGEDPDEAYDLKKPLILQTDAYTKGVSAVLLQDEKPIYFASRALHGSKRNYVAIELKALTVSWAVEKFHHYL